MTTTAYYADRLPRADNTAPAIDCAAITPSDSTAIVGGPCRGIYVGVTGDVNILTTGQNTVTFVAVPAGKILPVNALRVNATATTATSMVALF